MRPEAPGMMVTSVVRPDSVSLFVQRSETNVWRVVTSEPECLMSRGPGHVTRGRGSWGHQRIVWDHLSWCVTMTQGWLIITHLAVLLRWIQFAGPLHSRNMPLISNPGDWFTVDTVLTHEQIHFQYIFWFLGLLQLLLTQMMRFRCHDSKLWDDYCYYN